MELGEVDWRFIRTNLWSRDELSGKSKLKIEAELEDKVEGKRGHREINIYAYKIKGKKPFEGKIPN